MIAALSRRAQRAARPRLLRLSFFNACGFGLTTDSVIFLLALHYGASDTQTGFLYAAIYIAGFAAVLAPPLLNGRETTAIWGGFWWVRALACLAYFVLPWMDEPTAKVWVVIAVYYIFTAARAFGMAAMFPVEKALCPPRELAPTLARVFAIGGIGLLSARVLAYLVLGGHLYSFAAEEQAYMLLIAVGFVFNALTSRMIQRLPHTGTLEEGSLAGLVETGREMFATPRYREVAVLTVLQTGLAVCVGYQMNFLKHVAVLASGTIFLFVVLGVLAFVMVSNGLRAVLGHVSLRAFFLVTHGLLLACGLAWAFCGAGAPPALWQYGVLFVFATLGASVSLMLTVQLQTDRLPARRGVQMSVVYQVAAVVAALCTVGLLRVLAPWVVTLAGGWAHAYTHAFLLWSSLSLGILVFSLFLQKGERPLLADLALLAPANLRILFRAARLAEAEESTAKSVALEGLMMADTPASVGLLLEGLRTADMPRRFAALRVALRARVPESFPVLLAEATSLDSPLRQEAISALGLLGNRYAIAPLRRVLAQDDAALRACAVKSLLRLGEPLGETEVLAAYAAAGNTRSRLDILLGVADAGREALCWRILAEELAQRPGPYWSQVLLQFAAALRGRRESLIELFDEERRNAGAGLEYFLSDFEGDLPPDLGPDALRGLICDESFAELCQRLRAHGPAAPWVTAHDRTTALGVLFLWGLEAAARDA